MTMPIHATADVRAASRPGVAIAAPLVSRWLALAPEGRVTLRLGKVEIGQGITTALAQIAAEELDVSIEQLQLVVPNTVSSPDEGFTTGSRSIMEAGSVLRKVCAQARQILLTAAAEQLHIPSSELRVVGGRICDGGGAVRATYWQVDRPGLLDQAVRDTVECKPAIDYRIVGTSAARLDLEDKLTGQPRFIQDLALPGQLYGRVVRACSLDEHLIDVNVRPARSLESVVDVVRLGDFLGVVATREEEAILAAEMLRAHAIWKHSEASPSRDTSAKLLPTLECEDIVVAARHDEGATNRVVASLTSEYSRPYLAHASISPGCAVARWDGDTVNVWTHSQGIYPLRRAIAATCSLPAESVTVTHVEGAGCYGHNSADDVAMDAVLLAKAVPGRPVQVVWSRDDEFGREPFGPAMLARLAAGIDSDGNIVQWRHEVWGRGHSSRPGAGGYPNLLAGFESGATAAPVSIDPALPSGGNARNALPVYDIADLHVTAHRVLATPIRTSSLRSLGAMLNVFAIESMMDELAALAGVDPIAYRLRHLRDERARAVLEAVASSAAWPTRQAESNVGWGTAIARYKNVAGYCAVAARVEAVSAVKVLDLFVTVDVGRVINPDGLLNQLEGGAIQAASWALFEEVRFNAQRVASRSWDSYPIMPFSAVPTVHVQLIDRPDEPPLGAGEVTAGPVVAAIGNALTDAIGFRLRDLPFTARRVAAALRDYA